MNIVLVVFSAILLTQICCAAMVWGKSAKHSPQRCGVNHPLADEDVVQIVTKTNAQQRQSKNYQAMVQGFNDKVSAMGTVD